MTGNIVISAIIILGLITLFVGTGNPMQKARRQRWRDDQMDSEKPFQMGSDQTEGDQKQHFFKEDPQNHDFQVSLNAKSKQEQVGSKST